MSILDRFSHMLDAVVLVLIINFFMMSFNRSALQGLYPMWYLWLSTIILTVPDVVSEFFTQCYSWSLFWVCLVSSATHFAACDWIYLVINCWWSSNRFILVLFLSGIVRMSNVAWVFHLIFWSLSFRYSMNWLTYSTVTLNLMERYFKASCQILITFAE